ncbi:MAG TPA: acyl carrier protein [Myxococcales bacterium]|nr:acyl carrier protein [Deltaproteobacteria bacterium]HAA58607.1 acyl carrier protein [Myxococcales bacterium]|tara:strand:+ start:293 stop:538 length:246 start_codon:yes stop_codon:yes gene_type:complete
MSQQDVISKIHAILTEEFEIEPELLRQDAHLYEDIELDSLDAVDLVVSLEKAFSIKIAEETMRQIQTLHELCEMVSSSLPS